MRTTARSLTEYRPLQTKLDMIHMVKSRINQNTAFAEGVIRRSMSASDYDFPPASFVFIDTGDREEDNQAADSVTRLLITLNHYYMNQNVLIQNQYFINQLYRQIDYYMTRLRINSRSEYRELNRVYQQIRNSGAETETVKTDQNHAEALDRQLERRLFLITNQEAGRQYISKLNQERILNQTVNEQRKLTQSLSVPFYRMMRLAAQSSRVNDYKTIWKQSVDRQYSPEARKFLDYLEHMDGSERRDILEMLGEEEQNLYRKLRKVEVGQWRAFAAQLTERLEKFHTAPIRQIPADSHYDSMTSLNATGNDTERIPVRSEFWLSFIQEIHSSTSLEKEFYTQIQKSFQPETLSEKKQFLIEWGSYMEPSIWEHFLVLFSTKKKLEELTKESYRYIQMTESGKNTSFPELAEQRLNHMMKKEQQAVLDYIRQTDFGKWKELSEVEEEIIPAVSQLTLKSEFIDLIEQADELEAVDRIWTLASTDHILRESSETWRSYKADTLSEKKELLKEWIGSMDGSEWRHFLTLISENRTTHQPVIATELSNESYSSETGNSETQRILVEHKNWLSFLQKIQENQTKFSLFEELTGDDRQVTAGEKTVTETEERYTENLIREFDSESSQLILKNEFFDLIELTDETGTIDKIWTLASTDHILRESSETWRSYKADTLSEKKELLKEWIGYMDSSEWRHFLTLISKNRMTHQQVIQTKFSLFEELTGDDRQVTAGEKTVTETEERYTENLIREFDSESSQLILKNEFFDLIEQADETGTIDKIWTLASTDHILRKSIEAGRSHETENLPEKKERLKKWIEAMDDSELQHFLTLVSTRMKLQELTEMAGVQDTSKATFKASVRERPVLLHFLESLSYEDKAQFYQQLGAPTLFYQKDTGSSDQDEAACLANLLEKEQKAESEIFLVQLLQKSIYEEEKKLEKRMLWGSTVTALYQDEDLTRQAKSWKIPRWNEWDEPDTELRKGSVYSQTKGQDDGLAQTQEAVYEYRLLRLMKQMTEQELTQLYELQKTVVAAQTVDHMLSAIKNNSLSYSKREELWNTIAEAVFHNSYLYEKMEQKKMEQLIKTEQSENTLAEPALKNHSKELEYVDKILALLRDMSSGSRQRHIASKPFWNVGTSKRSSLFFEDPLKDITQLSRWTEKQPLRSEDESGSSLEYGPVNLVPGNRDRHAAPGIVRTPQMPVDIETKIEKTVRAKMKDINFINRRDAGILVSPEYEARIRTLADQVNFQKQEIEEIKSGNAKIIQNADTQKITNTVMKKLREQLQAERLRKGL